MKIANRWQKSVIVLLLTISIVLISSLLQPTNQDVPTTSGNIAEIDYYECFDLDTGTVRSFIVDCRFDPSWDFQFAYDSEGNPHTALYPNRSGRTLMAYSPKPFNDLNALTVRNLPLQSQTELINFVHIAIIRTSKGNYFKVRLVAETANKVTFEWENITFNQ